MKYLSAFTYILNEMSPYLLLGFLIAGLLHVYVPKDFYKKYLGTSSFKSVILSALFGVPLPLCSCGVIPTAVSLQKEGASKGATVSFLISTPQTGVDSIIATYSLMGPFFALIRPIAAFVTALFGGFLTNALETKDEQNQLLDDHGEDGHDHSCGCGCGCGCGGKKKSKLRQVLEYGFSSMIKDIGKRLVFGLLVAGLITVFVPDTFFTQFADRPLIGMFAVLLVAIPMYICATGSIPIAVALMIKGMTPGAALVLLMAGPAVNIASIFVVSKAMGKKTLVVYLISIILGAIGFGLVIDNLLPREFFTKYLPETVAAHHHMEWWKAACSVLFAALFLRVWLVKPLLRRFR